MRRIHRARMQCRQIIIDETSHIFPHDLFKNHVRAVQHFPAAAEVLMQVDPSGFDPRATRLPVVTGFCLFLSGIGLIFLQKQFRPRQTELVYALFHVSHHKPVVSALFLAGDAGQNVLLYQIAVLIFIDQYLMEITTVFQRRLRRHTSAVLFSLNQNGQCKMLYVIEIQNVLIPFLRIKSPLECQRQIHQPVHRRAADLHLLQDLFFRPEKVLLLQIAKLLLHLCAQILRQFTLDYRNRVVLLRGQPVKVQRAKSSVECVIPFHAIHLLRAGSLCLTTQSQQSLRHLPLALQQFSVHVRSVRFLAQTDCLRQLRHAARKKKLYLPQHLRRPGKRLECRACLFRLPPESKPVILLPLFQPLLWKRSAHGKVIEL